MFHGLGMFRLPPPPPTHFFLEGGSSVVARLMGSVVGTESASVTEPGKDWSPEARRITLSCSRSLRTGDDGSRDTVMNRPSATRGRLCFLGMRKLAVRAVAMYQLSLWMVRYLSLMGTPSRRWSLCIFDGWYRR